jgi:hypothetical protein
MITLEEMTRRGGRIQQALAAQGLDPPEVIGILACGMGCSLMELDPDLRVDVVKGILTALEKLGIRIDQHGRVVVAQTQ